MKEQAIMYLIGYDKDFKTACKTGWGCGYVAIPADSDLVKNHYANVAKEQAETDYFVSDYLQIGDNEITYTAEQEINGVNYLTIGFDTAHSWNSDKHDFNYVFTETAKLLAEVNGRINA